MLPGHSGSKLLRADSDILKRVNKNPGLKIAILNSNEKAPEILCQNRIEHIANMDGSQLVEQSK
jgi:hypothetical protein